MLKTIRELLKENWSAGEQKEEVIGEEIPVPLPPYAKIEEKVEVKVETPKIEAIPKSFKPVEEMIPFPPKNIIEEKLNGTTTSDHTISDYTTPQVSEKISDPVPQSHDPYREPIK